MIAWGLLALTYLFVEWVVIPPLRHLHSAPTFFWEGRFLGPFLSRPGGLLEWTAALVAQGERLPWLGAMIATAFVGLTGWFTSRLLRRREKPAGLMAYGPSLILVALLGRYEAPVLQVAGAGLLILGALSAWQSGSALPTSVRLTVFWIGAGCLFYVAGTWPFLVFVSAGGGMAAARRQPRLGLLCWTAGSLALPGWWLFPEASLTTALERWGNGWALGLILTFWAFLAVGLPVILAWPLFGSRTSRKTSGRSGSLRTLRTPGGDEPGRMAAVGFTVVVILLMLSFDGRQKRSLEIQRAAEQARWDEVLNLARGRADNPPQARLQVHRALGHLGLLADQLFTLPQQRGLDLLPTLVNGIDLCLPLSDVLLDLGHVNLAERYAHEALEIFGERPAVLRRLARLNVLKDRPQAARVFLNHLANVPGQRSWAEHRLRKLEADPRLSGEPEIARLRAVQVRTRHTEVQFSTSVILESAAQAGPQNRMAFEFLLAHYLLTGQGEAILRMAPRLRELGYTAVPRHVEEALLLLARGQGDEVSARCGLHVRPESIARYHRYVEAARQAAGTRELAEAFGDTFWFYSQFGRSYVASP